MNRTRYIDAVLEEIQELLEETWNDLGELTEDEQDRFTDFVDDQFDLLENS